MRTALRLKEDDPLVQQLVQIMRKVNRVAEALRENLEQQTQQLAEDLSETATEAMEAYRYSWHHYSETIADAAEISNDLRELDDQADHWIEFLDDQYALAMELDLQATQQDYPDDHPVFQLVDLIEKTLNLKVD